MAEELSYAPHIETVMGTGQIKTADTLTLREKNITVHMVADRIVHPDVVIGPVANFLIQQETATAPIHDVAEVLAPPIELPPPGIGHVVFSRLAHLVGKEVSEEPTVKKNPELPEKEEQVKQLATLLPHIFGIGTDEHMITLFHAQEIKETAQELKEEEEEHVKKQQELSYRFD